MAEAMKKYSIEKWKNGSISFFIADCGNIVVLSKIELKELIQDLCKYLGKSLAGAKNKS